MNNKILSNYEILNDNDILYDDDILFSKRNAVDEKILFAISKICKQITPGKKMIQKLLYLLQRKGFYMGLDYSIHYYGPYSAELSDKLYEYDVYRYISINTAGQTHKIKINTTVKTTISKESELLLDDVLEKYIKKTPLQLELLTTTDYAANTLLAGKAADEQEIAAEVLRIKGSKFTKDKIEESINELKKDELIYISGR